MKVEKLLTILEEDIPYIPYLRRIKLSKRILETDKHPRHKKGKGPKSDDYYEFEDKKFKDIFEIIKTIRKEPWNMTLDIETLTFEPVDHNLLSHSDVVIYEGDYTKEEANFIDYFIKLTDDEYETQIKKAKQYAIQPSLTTKPKVDIE